jgi:hypothetical protein
VSRGRVWALGRLDNRRPFADRVRIVHWYDRERCLEICRCGKNWRGMIRGGHYFGLDKGVSESSNDEEEETDPSRRCIYRFGIVDRNDRGRIERPHWRRGFLLARNGRFVLDRLLGSSGDIDAPLVGRLRSGGGNLFLLLYGDWRRNGGDLRLLCGGWFVTGRVGFFRFRGGVIYIIDVSSPVGLGRSLVDGGPPAIDDKFVQNLFLPWNADDGNESGGALIHTKGTSPLKSGNIFFKDLQTSSAC